MESNDFILYILILVLFLLMCIPRKEDFTSINRKKISNLNYYKGYPEKGLYVKDLKKVIHDLDKKLSKHIVFIEQVYGPLQKSIDKFKRFFK